MKVKELEVPSAIFNVNVLKISEAIKCVQNGFCLFININDQIKVYASKGAIKIEIKEV